MRSKIRILFSIESGDQWVLEAYKGFFDSLRAQGNYEIFCTSSDGSLPDEALWKYNLIDYERLSRTGAGLLAAGFLSGTSADMELLKQVQQSVCWSRPKIILKRFSLFNVTLNLLQPDIVIVWNGMTDMRLLARRLLERLQIAFFYAEKGFLPDSWYIDEVGINARCSLDASSFEQTIHPEEKTKVEDYIQKIVKSGSSAWQQPSRITGELTLKEKLEIDSGSRVIFFPGQVDDDVNITTFSPFENVAGAVGLVAESMPAKTVLLVKPHPRAKESSKRQLSGLAEKYNNLVVAKDANIWDLIEISDLVISINSTVAFESLLKKKKVLLLGDSVLSKTSLLRKVDKADLKRHIQEYLSASFESLIDYSRLLSFIKFLKEDYYMFRGSAQLSAAVEQRLTHRAKLVSPKIFTPDVLMSMFYKGASQHRFLNNRAQTVKAGSATSSPFTLKLSVVLTTYNRPGLLEKVLAGFANQTVPREDFEVIIVDDGSEPAVKRIAEKFSDQMNAVYLRQENSGLAAARNNGIRAAKGQIVLFSDDDDLPGPELIAEHLRSHQENPDEQVAVLGNLNWHKDLKVTALMEYVTRIGGEYFGCSNLEDGQFYDVWKWWGGLVSAKLSLLKSVQGPFDSRLRFGYEDIELACRLLNRNVKVLYNSKAKSFVIRPVSFEDFCKRRYMQGQALYHVANLHPQIIIPRYRLQDAQNEYYIKYAAYLDEWSNKVIQFEKLLDNQSHLGNTELNKYLKSLYTVYRKCFRGYEIKGYVEQMVSVKSGKVLLSEPVNKAQVSRSIQDDKVSRYSSSDKYTGSDYNRISSLCITNRSKIVFVSTVMPVFDRTSANLRIYQILNILTDLGYKIDYLYFKTTDNDDKYIKAFNGLVNFIYFSPVVENFINYFNSNDAGEVNYLWITNLWDVDYGRFAFGLSEWIKFNRPGTKIIIDTMDFHYKKLLRKFNLSGNEKDRRQAEQFLEVESKLYPLADNVLAVTDVERRDILENIGPECNVTVIPNIHEILDQCPVFEQRSHICFLGALHVSHNADAVRWFLKEVFPFILNKAPDVEFHILGFNSEKFKAEFEAKPNVKVIGYVDDAELAIAKYKVFVCPMIYGAGMKGKLGVAASAGTPIVTTAIGAEGFDFVDGQDCFIIDEPQGFANKCLRLLSENPLWSQFSIKAKDIVAKKFSIKAVSKKINALLQQVTTVESGGKINADSFKVPSQPDYVDPWSLRDRQIQAGPKVSIVTSCYNSERFLPECLDSIRNQTMQEWELFLLDDGSTDGTRRIIENYSQVDKRIRPYYFQDNKGPYVRRNFAIERATSDFIVIQDADDIMCPTKLQLLYNEILKDERLTVVGSFYWVCLEEFRGSEFADKVELYLSHEQIMQSYDLARYICWHGSAIIRKEIFESIGQFDENPYGSDRFWLAKVAEYASYNKEIRFSNIPECLTIKREHPLSQQGLLPILDPRNRRARFRTYWGQKLQEIRNKIQRNPSIDIMTELKNCKCCDYIQRYGHLFEQWESEPLDNDFIAILVKRASMFFNKGKYVTCIVNLESIEKMCPQIAEMLKNFDLLRGKAYFELEKRQQSLKYLKQEIQHHNNPVAEQFLADNFSMQKCQEHLIIDLKSKKDAGQELYDIAHRDIIARQIEQEQTRRSRRHSEAEPRVSVIIPTYNADEYISKAIESILAQDYGNFELIIINDGSIDDTEKIVKNFSDSRIHYIYQENSGVASACNVGIKSSNGAFIVRLDADDMMAPGFIVTHIQEFEKHPEADLVYCDDYLIDKDDKPIRVIERPEYSNQKALIRDLFRYGFPIVPFRACIKLDVFDEIGFFDEQLITAEDYDMIRRFVKRGLNAHHLKGTLYLRRLTADCLSRTGTEVKARCHFDVIKRFIETFSYDELFPDVNWDKIIPQRHRLNFKYLAGVTCVTMGQAYVRNNSPIYANMAFSLASEQLRKSLKMDPSNYRVQQLLQQCESAQAKYEREIYEKVG